MDWLTTQQACENEYKTPWIIKLPEVAKRMWFVQILLAGPFFPVMTTYLKLEQNEALSCLPEYI